MMRILKYFVIVALATLAFQACDKEDSGIITVPLRDYAEVEAEEVL